MGLRIRSGPVGSLALQSLRIDPGPAVLATYASEVRAEQTAASFIGTLRSALFAAAITPNLPNFGSLIVATSGIAFTINAPGNNNLGAPPLAALATTDVATKYFTICIKNASGGLLGVVTFDAIYHLAGAFVNPLNGFNRSLTFLWDGAAFLEVARSAADVAN